MTTTAPTTSTRSRWLALYVLCLGDLMIVLDQSIVNVALPSIRDDLGFSQSSLACQRMPHVGENALPKSS